MRNTVPGAVTVCEPFNLSYDPLREVRKQAIEREHFVSDARS